MIPIERQSIRPDTNDIREPPLDAQVHRTCERVGHNGFESPPYLPRVEENVALIDVLRSDEIYPRSTMAELSNREKKDLRGALMSPREELVTMLASSAEAANQETPFCFNYHSGREQPR